MQQCEIRVRETQQVLRVFSSGPGWIDAKGNFYHKSQAKLVRVIEENNGNRKRR